MVPLVMVHCVCMLLKITVSSLARSVFPYYVCSPVNMSGVVCTHPWLSWPVYEWSNSNPTHTEQEWDHWLPLKGPSPCMVFGGKNKGYRSNYFLAAVPHCVSWWTAVWGLIGISGSLTAYLITFHHLLVAFALQYYPLCGEGWLFFKTLSHKAW